MLLSVPQKKHFTILYRPPKTSPYSSCFNFSLSQCNQVTNSYRPFNISPHTFSLVSAFKKLAFYLCNLSSCPGSANNFFDNSNNRHSSIYFFPGSCISRSFIFNSLFFCHITTPFRSFWSCNVQKL